LKPGERFDPARLAQARQDLVAAGTFASVVVEPATATDASGALPVTVRVKERSLRVVNLGAAFSTDQGGSASASWMHRNLFGGAEQLTVSAAATQLGGSASVAPGYNLGAVLMFPDWQRRDQKLTLNVNAVREYLRAYDRTGATLGATVSRPLWQHWTASLGLSFTQEQVVQEGDARDYSLLQLTAGMKYDSSDDLLDPKRGVRGLVTLTPTASFGGIGQANFLIGQASAAVYFDLSGNGRTVLAGRALVGAIMGAGAFGVPPDQRFYGGGSGTIRGYRYQSVGPQFPSNRPIGGTAVDAGSIELRQRFLESWGAVAFVDAGQVSADGVPFSGPIKVGAGAGARYYTAIGPVRLDVAVPLNKDRKADAFELYIGLGHAF
jgi:translocation and assembly module TamA